MKILIFGNSLVEQDNLPIRLIPKLKQEFPNFQFIHLDPTEDLQSYGPNLTIIDTAQEINQVQLLTLSSIEDFNKFKINKIYTMHDFDLGYNLKLLKKLNLIDKVQIVCIPQNISEQEAFHQTQLILRKFVAHDIHGS